MKKIVIIFLLIITYQTSFSQDISGKWLGTLNIMNNKLRVGFTIERRDTIYISKMDSPDQNAFDLPTNKTSFINSKLEIAASGLGVNYEGVLEGDSINGTFKQGGISFPLILKRNEKPMFNRPQEPQSPFPYKSEEVTFENKKDNITLAGTLTMPNTNGIFPAVILIAGSGPNDRDENILGHKPFLVIADYLTKNGFAVLRYDKRGVGSSKGDFKLATIDDFTADAKSAIDFLKNNSKIDKKQIGVIGHSEGGIVASMLAANNKKDIAFVVLMASPGISGIEIIMKQNEISMQQSGMEVENIERIQKMNREIFENMLDWENTEINRNDLRDRLRQLWEQLPILIKLQQKKEVFVRNQFNAIVLPGYRSFLKSQPEKFIQKISAPVLAVNGEKDMQVDSQENLSAIKNALEKEGKFKHEIKSYPDLNHLFQECETGQADEYGKIEQTISPQVLEDITNWLKKQTSQNQ